MKHLTILFFLFLSAGTYAQTGIGTTTPHASAQLEVSSTSKGFLPPRMTTAQRDAIIDPTDGLQIYNITTKTLEYKTESGWVSLISNPDGVNAGDMQYWNGTAWVVVTAGLEGQKLTFVNGVPVWVDKVLTLTDGEVLNPTTGKIWMDRNLGATRVATSSTNASSYGVLYQWGRGTDGHQIRTSGITTVQSSLTIPGNTFITGSSNWYIGTNPDNLWKGVNGINNPCISGYRLPTEAEWEAERATWSSQDAAGAFASPLKLPLAGIRYNSNGSLYDVGTLGVYWSSTVSSPDSRYLGFSSSNANMYTGNRAFGLAVRCLKD